ncbi:MAG: hypothetical protein GYA17_00780 [Chloroflexi bacterium]|nr:hypothetical protein [Chloroflexota bacterium]
MKALTFTIRLLDPLLLSRLGAGEENSAASYHYIPGSVIRGALIAEFGRAHENVKDIARHPLSHQLFFDGQVCYLNAYPLDRDGMRMLPRPLSWRVEKDPEPEQRNVIYDFAVQVDSTVLEPKNAEEKFASLSGTEVHLAKVDEMVFVHNASDDPLLKKRGTSTVYRYESLARGQRFGAVISAQEAGDLAEIQGLLEKGSLAIGGSRSASYGKVIIEDVCQLEEWCEAPQSEAQGKVIVTLLSDAILKNQSGQYCPDLDAALGAQHATAYYELGVVGGFNRKWGLPLNQTPVVQAGSVFVYDANRVDAETLERAIENGVGERRVEGFGRLAINWNVQPCLSIPETKNKASSSSPDVALSPQSKELAGRMAGRMLRSKLDQALMASVANLKIERPPRNAQLSRLRLAVLESMRLKDAQGIANHLAALKKQGIEQWERARIDNRAMDAWLKQSVDELWKIYLQPKNGPIPAVAGVEAEVTSELKLEYVFRMVEGILRKTGHERKAEGDAQ